MLATEITAGIVFLSWLVFAIGFLFRRRGPGQVERLRDSQAIFGLLLEAAGYLLVFSIRRESLTAFLPFGPTVELLVAVVSALLSASSAWLLLAAINILGRHWSPAARIIEAHELVTEGPYRIVRHPIYTGMFGLMIATGLVIAKPWALAVAVVLYLLGTTLRIRVEERLLVQHFGKQYANYKSKVPALIPYVV